MQCWIQVNIECCACTCMIIRNELLAAVEINFIMFPYYMIVHYLLAIRFSVYKVDNT